MNDSANEVRRAIENLINVKLYDVLSHPDGLARLAIQRSTGVASPTIRHAGDALQKSLEKCHLTPEEVSKACD